MSTRYPRLTQSSLPPLALALLNELYEAIEIMLKGGANLHQLFHNDNSLLHLLLIQKDESVASQLEFLLRHNLNIDGQNADGNTPLHIAAVKANLALVGDLLKHGADRNLLNHLNRNPLMEAAAYAGLDLYRLLEPRTLDTRYCLHLATLNPDPSLFH